MGLAFHVENFGCRAARADGEAVSARLRAAGLEEQAPADADVLVVNTCSVTAEADRAARAFIRKAHRTNPEARIVVTGCYAQREPQELAALPGVAAVVGNSHKAFTSEIALKAAREESPAGAVEAAPPRLVTIQSLPATSLAGSTPIWADDTFAHSFLEETHLVPGAQTRPNLKIQEGCGNRCTFCVIPETRGPSKSLAAAGVLRQINEFVAAGGNELVLSGINLGRWGRDLAVDQGVKRLLFAGLVRRILTETTLPRLRLSSIEPMDWDAELIGLMREFGAARYGESARLARHAHLPLQSGSDTVLRRMHRRYRPWHYVEKVSALVEAAGDWLTLGADVMVAFPGETDTEFQETVDLVEALPFGYLHLFPFSPRPGTPGWDLHLRAPVPAAVAEERMAVLRALGSRKTEAHRRRFLGRMLQVVTLHSPGAVQSRGRTAALSENFIPVEIEGDFEANQLLDVKGTALTADCTLVAKA